MAAEKPIQFEIKAKDCDAKGQLFDDGFVVLKGSRARKEVVASATQTVVPQQQKLIAEGVITENNGQLRFVKDHMFDSPSGAAAIVMGRTANGWVEWKLPDGRKLSEAKNDSIHAKTTSLMAQLATVHNQLSVNATKVRGRLSTTSFAFADKASVRRAR